MSLSARVASPTSWPLFGRMGFDVGLAAGTGLAASLAGAILPALFRQAGVGALALAAFSAAPLAGGLLALQFSAYLQSSGRRAAIVRAASCLAFCALPFMPTAVGLGLWCLVTIVNSIFSPLQHLVWGVLYSQDRRMQCVGISRLAGSALSLLLVAGGTHLADTVGGLPVIALAGMCGVMASGGYIGLPFQAKSASLRPSASIETIKRFWRHPALRRLFNAHLLFGFGMTAAAPLYTLRQVDAYHLTLTELGLIASFGSMAGMLTGPLWGRIADRLHGGWVMAVGALCIAVGPWCYVVSLPHAWLYFAAASMGAGMTAIDMGLTAVYSATVPLHERPNCSAAWSALTGARGLLAPFLTGWLSQAGILSSAQLLGGCAAVMGAGVIAYARAVIPPRASLFQEVPLMMRAAEAAA